MRRDIFVMQASINDGLIRADELLQEQVNNLNTEVNALKEEVYRLKMVDVWHGGEIEKMKHKRYCLRVKKEREGSGCS